MESLGTSPKRNDGGDGRPWGVAAQSWATAPATLTEKRAMKKEEREVDIQIHTRSKNYLLVTDIYGFKYANCWLWNSSKQHWPALQKDIKVNTCFLQPSIIVLLV